MICGTRYSENQNIVGATMNKNRLERLFLACVTELKNKKIASIVLFIAGSGFKGGVQACLCRPVMIFKFIVVLQ